MSYIDYIEIENFKGFGAKVRVPLGNPCVLVGPNNSGKTTVLQALSLWGRAVFEWWDRRKRGKLETDGTVVLNRLMILEVPVRETRYLWRGMSVHGSSGEINFTLTVGVRVGGNGIRPLRMEFRYHDQESVKCAPAEDSAKDSELIEQAAKLKFGLLHPMSGIASAVSDSTDEPLVAPGRVNVLLGQGQTAQALRNVCYQLWEKSPEDWGRVAEIMGRIFKCEFAVPMFDPGRGSLVLNYCPIGLDDSLEIVLAGRGLQQMLLLLAYFYGHKGQVMLFDEPDAHLEILRQKQMFSLLNEIADETASQIVIVTHSEVLLDEAYETSLVCLANGAVADISDRRDIRTTLRNLGFEHYFKAEQKQRLLIVEGSTDVAILKALAKKLNHPALDVLDDTVFTFYTQDVKPEADENTRIERFETEGLDYRRYVLTLKRLVPSLRALAIFDSDGRDVGDDSISADFKILRWKRYEIENYFITPEILKKYLVDNEVEPSVADKCIESVLAEMLFDGDVGRVGDYHAASLSIRIRLLADVKMSKFAEEVFESVAKATGDAVLINKGEYFKLVSLLTQEEIPREVVDRLDLLVQMLGIPVKPVGGPVNSVGGPVKSSGEPVNTSGGPVKSCGEPVKAGDEPVNLEGYGPVKLLDIIRNNPGLRKNKLAEMANLPERTVKRYIEDVLVGRVEFRGAPKTGGYYVL